MSRHYKGVRICHLPAGGYRAVIVLADPDTGPVVRIVTGRTLEAVRYQIREHVRAIGPLLTS